MAEKKDWARVVAQYKESGLSQAEYARRHGLAVSQLGYHIGAIRKSGGFVKITPGTTEDLFEVELRNGVKLKLPLGIEPSVLQRLVGALNAEA